MLYVALDIARNPREEIQSHKLQAKRFWEFTLNIIKDKLMCPKIKIDLKSISTSNKISNTKFTYLLNTVQLLIYALKKLAHEVAELGG